VRFDKESNPSTIFITVAKKTFRFTNLKDLYLSPFLPLKLDTNVKRKTVK